MAYLDENTGSINACCPGCGGSKSSFKYDLNKQVIKSFHRTGANKFYIRYMLYECLGCKEAALATIVTFHPNEFPVASNELIAFSPEVSEKSELPDSVPEGIVNEFREAEVCIENNCYRAAAGLFRSVLDKTMKANGYKKEGNLYKQIEKAAEENVIHRSRQKRAHQDIRVLGNDVLHDDWKEIASEDVEAARHFSQRILEDLYVDRDVIEEILNEHGRLNKEDNDNVKAA